MKRHLPGLHAEASRGDGVLEGVFLVRVDRAYYRWHLQKPSSFSALRSSNPAIWLRTKFQDESTAPRSHSGN
jgi:hypothetical protein